MVVEANQQISGLYKVPPPYPTLNFHHRITHIITTQQLVNDMMKNFRIKWDVDVIAVEKSTPSSGCLLYCYAARPKPP